VHRILDTHCGADVRQNQESGVFEHKANAISKVSLDSVHGLRFLILLEFVRHFPFVAGTTSSSQAAPS
jgi:hypothetical protein